MMTNIVLSGGSTMMPGFQHRIKQSLFTSNEIDSSSYNSYQVIAERNRHIATWLGASMIASMSAFDKLFIKKSDFSENGEERHVLFSKIF
jgi:actin